FREPVNQQYFETLGARLLEGRNFNVSDDDKHPTVLIINETMAKRFWPNESAIGKRIGNSGQDHHWQEIVGVVNDIEYPGTLDEPYTRLQSFVPMAQSPSGGGWCISLRGSKGPETLAGPLRDAVAEIDPDLPVYDIRTARSLVDRGLGPVSLLGTLLGA